jgi:hypothetical protein
VKILLLKYFLLPVYFSSFKQVVDIAFAVSRVAGMFEGWKKRELISEVAYKKLDFAF